MNWMVEIRFRFRRTGVMAKPGQSEAQSVTCYGIASVFTPAYNRSKGYASHMMRLLHWVLAPINTLPPFPPEWGSPPPDGPHDAQFSVLYSDIGSEFYANCGPVPQDRTGWKTTSPVSTFWKVDRDEGSQSTTFNSNEWIQLNKQEAEELWERDSILMARDVISASNRTGKVIFTFLPNGGVGGCSIQRTMTFTPNLEPVLDKTHGLMRRSGSADSDKSDVVSFVTWAHEPATTTMVLTRIRVSSQDFPQVLQELKEVAKAAGKDTIEAWNVPDHLNGNGGQVVIRDEHLPAVKWYGPEEQEQPLWLFNEKYVFSLSSRGRVDI
jgi:hypothetical protein